MKVKYSLKTAVTMGSIASLILFFGGVILLRMQGKPATSGGPKSADSQLAKYQQAPASLASSAGRPSDLVNIIVTYQGATRSAALAIEPPPGPSSRGASATLGGATASAGYSMTGMGKTRYVSPSGSDTNPGSESRPFKTIQRAADVVNAGDTVIVKDGVYVSAGPNYCAPSTAIVCVHRGGSPSAYVTFRSENKWGAKVDGENRVPFGFYFFAGYVRIEGFDVYGMSSAASDAGGFVIYNGGWHTQIVGNHIHDIGKVCDAVQSQGMSGIFIQSDPSGRDPVADVLVEGNLIHDIGRYETGQNGCGRSNPDHDHGIYADDGDDVTIRNNIFYNIKNGWAIQIYPRDRARLNILNNTFAFTNQHAGKEGAIVWWNTGLTDSKIKNNVFYQPRGGAIWLSRAINAVISGVDISNNLTCGGPVISSGSNGGTAGMILNNNFDTKDPMFFNVGSPPFDFHLRPGSPAIDQGVALPGVSTDYDGRARPQGRAFDLGAYEFHPNSSSDISLYCLTLDSSWMPDGSSTQASVRLSGPAPPGGALVSLSTSDGSLASVPPTVIVPAGAWVATFTVTSHQVRAKPAAKR